MKRAIIVILLLCIATITRGGTTQKQSEYYIKMVRMEHYILSKIPKLAKEKSRIRTTVQHIMNKSIEHKIPVELSFTVFFHEGCGFEKPNHLTIGKIYGEIGYAQGMTNTYKWLGYTTKQMLQTEYNIDFGSKYLAKIHKKTQSTFKTLAEYNGGPTGYKKKKARYYAKIVSKRLKEVTEWLNEYNRSI